MKRLVRLEGLVRCEDYEDYEVQRMDNVKRAFSESLSGLSVQDSTFSIRRIIRYEKQRGNRF